MVKPRNRKTERGFIPQCIYEEAAKKVIDEGKSVTRVAKDYGMCHVSLNRFVNVLRADLAPKLGYHPHNKVFSTEQEQLWMTMCLAVNAIPPMFVFFQEIFQ
jgi:hypothetical protein